MSKKSKMNIGTFTIVSKHPKGQKSNVIYKFEYQRSGSPEIHQVQMIWLEFRKEKTWAFMNGREADKLTSDEREEFIAEIPKFQMGGAYRKTHPIAYSKSGSIKQAIKHKEYELQILKNSLDSALDEELNIKCNKYKKLIDTKKLDFINKQLKKICDKTNYIVKLKYVGCCNKIVIYDIDKSIPVGEIISVLDNNKESFKIKPLGDYDIKSFIKKNENVSNMLEE